MAITPMVDLAMDDEDILDLAPYKLDSTYPPGMRICLTRHEFKALDLDPKEAIVGGTVHGHFLGTIKNVNHGEDGSRVEIQIEKLNLESEDEEND